VPDARYATLCGFTKGFVVDSNAFQGCNVTSIPLFTAFERERIFPSNPVFSAFVIINSLKDP
jgi:hypothetical protein